jgi:hypothetical protein
MSLLTKQQWLVMMKQPELPRADFCMLVTGS